MSTAMANAFDCAVERSGRLTLLRNGRTPASIPAMRSGSACSPAGFASTIPADPTPLLGGQVLVNNAGRNYTLGGALTVASRAILLPMASPTARNCRLLVNGQSLFGSLAPGKGPGPLQP